MTRTDQVFTAGVVIVGNEILTGKVDDRNGPFVISQAKLRGIDLAEIHVVADKIDAIAEAVDLVRHRRDICITSGGIGPTHDDVTVTAVAAAFDMPLEERPELVEMIERVFGTGDRARAWRKLASVPIGCEMLELASGWPAYAVENVYILPGIPEIFNRQVCALLDRFDSTPVMSRTIYFRAGEGELAGMLDDVASKFAGSVDIGSYPRLDSREYKVKVTLDSRVPEALKAAVSLIEESLSQYLVRDDVTDEPHVHNSRLEPIQGD